MADSSTLSLLLYKGSNLVTTGDKGAGSVTLTGLSAGTVVADGDYSVAFTDGVSVGEKVAVPGFTVKTA